MHIFWACTASGCLKKKRAELLFIIIVWMFQIVPTGSISERHFRLKSAWDIKRRALSYDSLVLNGTVPYTPLYNLHHKLHTMLHGFGIASCCQNIYFLQNGIAQSPNCKVNQDGLHIE